MHQTKDSLGGTISNRGTFNSTGQRVMLKTKYQASEPSGSE